MGHRSLVKFDVKTRIEVIELASRGYTYTEIAKMIGVARSTLDRWRQRDERFNKAIQEGRTKGLRDTIEVGLRRLAEGAKREEVTEEWMEAREDTKGEARVVKVKRKVIEHAPSEKAIVTLAKKHAHYYSNDETNGEVTNILNVNTSNYSMRDVQEALANSPIERVELSDYKYLEHEESGEGGEVVEVESMPPSTEGSVE